MADDSDDPYVKAGRALTSGGQATPTTTTAPGAGDPYVAAGRAVTSSAPATTTTTGAADATDQAPSWTWRGVAREIGAAGPRIAANVSNILSDPYANLVGYPALTALQAGYDFLAPKLGYNQLSPEDRAALYEDFGMQPGTHAIKTAGNIVGTDPYNVQGSTPTEQRVGSIVEGAGTAGTAGPGGISALIAGGAGTVGSEIAQDYVPDWLKPFAGVVGGTVGAKAGAETANIGTKAVNVATGKTTPVAAAYDELGIDRNLVGDVSGGPTARLLQAYGSKSPFGSSVVSPVEQKVVGQFNGAVENTASRLGASNSEQGAGEVLQQEARNWKDVVFPQRQAQAWAPVDQLLGNEAVAPSNYRAALTSLTSKLAGLPDTAKALIPSKTWQLLDAINTDVPAGQTMSWPQAQSLRSAIGQVMGVPEIVQSIGKDQLKRAYGGISHDMQDTAAAVDARNAAAAPPGTPPPASAVDAFNNANKVSTDGHAFIEGPLSKIIKTSNPAQDRDPEQATRSILGSTGSTLEAIRKEMPKAADELAAYKLRDMALATPGAAGRTGQETSVVTFLTDLNRLRQQSPEGFKALYSDQTVARKIDALATVADTMKETSKRANVSGTGPYMALSEAGGTALATYLATQNPLYAVASVAAPFVANRVAGHAAVNPLAARLAGAPGPRVLPNPLLTSILANQQQQPR